MNDGRLGRAIDHRRGKASQPARDAAVIDDAAGPLLLHVGRGVFHAEHDAADQGRHRGVKAVNLEALNAAGLRRAAGIVEQAIDPAEFFHRQRDQRAHLVLDRDIGLAEDAVRAELFGQRLALRHATPGDDDFGAFGNENFRSTQTNAARRAGDHRNLAVQPSHIVISHNGRLFAADSQYSPPEGSNASTPVSPGKSTAAPYRPEMPLFRPARPYFGFADHVK